MSKVYQEMLEALRTSVLEIDASDPADRATRLAKQFDAFAQALNKRLDEDLPLSMDEADPVSLLGDRLGRLSEAVTAIEEGLIEGSDGVSEDSLMLAKGLLEFGGLALNAAASDFATSIDEGEEVEEGMGLYKVASAGGEVLVKSALPEQAAMFTADPADTAEKLVEFFMEGLDWLGVPVVLAKKAPPPFARGKGRGAPAAEAEGDEGDEAEGDEAEGDEAEGDEGDEGAFAQGDEGEEGQDEGEEGDGGSPLENIARLSSLALIELDAIKQQLGGGGEMMDDPEGGLTALDALGQHLALAVVQADALNGAAAGADMGEEGDFGAEGANDMEGQGAEPGDDGRGDPMGDQTGGDGGDEGFVPPDDEAEKGVKAGDLKKRAAAIAAGIVAGTQSADQRATEAEARAAAAEAKLVALEKANGAKPADPKAQTGVAATALTKMADSGGSGGETRDEMAARLGKMDPALAAQELIKMSFRNPMPLG